MLVGSRIPHTPTDSLHVYFAHIEQGTRHGTAWATINQIPRQLPVTLDFSSHGRQPENPPTPLWGHRAWEIFLPLTPSTVDRRRAF